MSEFYGALSRAAPSIFLEITGDWKLRGRRTFAGCVVWIGNHGTRRVKRQLTDPFRPMSILIPITVCTPSKVQGLPVMSVASPLLREEMTVRQIKRTDRRLHFPTPHPLKANDLLIFCFLVWPTCWIEATKKLGLFVWISNMLLLHFKSRLVPISRHERCRTSQTSVGPSFLIAVIFISQIAFQVWELYWGIRRVNRHTRLVWIPACAEANSLHYSAQFATCPRLGKSPERPLNLLHCSQRLQLCCTCQNGQTQLINTLPTSDTPTENTPSLATSSSALGLRGWQFPDLRELRRSRCLAQAAPAVAKSFSSAPLNRPVWFMILLLTSAISDHPLMRLQLTRIQLWVDSWRAARLRTKGRVLFCIWFPAFVLNTNCQQTWNQPEL